MPKATLEFNLPEDEGALSITLNAGKMYSALWNIGQEIRRHDKYGEHSPETKKILEEIRSFFYAETQGLLEE